MGREERRDRFTTVVVEKRPVAREEVRIRKDVRREEVEVDEDVERRNK